MLFGQTGRVLLRHVRTCVMGAVALLLVVPQAQADNGMLDWTDAEITQALDAFVPRLMDEANVPGAQVALMRDGVLVYERAFGVGNVITRSPVTTETIFEAASLSKPVTAHLALQMVAAGKLRLDTDIGLGIEPPWLEPDARGRIPAITLRQILTHTSGLSNDLRRTEHRLAVPPGKTFAYSGEGFDYLGYAISAYEQSPFANVVRARLLEPLGMRISGFALDESQLGQVATGHIPLWMPLGMVLVPFVIMFVVGVLIAFFVVRVVVAQPHLEPGHLLLPAIAGGLASLLAVLELAGLGLLVAVFLITFIFLLCVALAGILWRLAFHVLGLTRVRPGTVMRREEISAGMWTRIAFGLGLLSLLPLLFMSVPIPVRAAGDVHPASSLRGTAGEIALFAREVMASQLLSAADMRAMTSPQVKVGHGAPDGISWGLGIGIRDRVLSDGDVQRTLWQWGSNPGYTSLMVIEPDAGTALVVMTNAQSGGAMAQELGAHMFGGLDSVDEIGGWTLPFEAIAPMF